jgi:hypothetical protein
MPWSTMWLTLERAHVRTYVRTYVSCLKNGLTRNCTREHRGAAGDGVGGWEASWFSLSLPLSVLQSRVLRKARNSSNAVGVELLATVSLNVRRRIGKPSTGTSALWNVNSPKSSREGWLQLARHCPSMLRSCWTCPPASAIGIDTIHRQRLA